MPQVAAANDRAAAFHDRAAIAHGKSARLFDLNGQPERADRERVLAKMARGMAAAERERARLRREWNASRSGESAGELGEHG